MTRSQDDIVVIEPEPDAECQLCHEMKELRPYGPQGEHVCVTCAQKDPIALERALQARFADVKVALVLFPPNDKSRTPS